MTSDSGHEKTGAQQTAFCREHKEDFYRFPSFFAVCETNCAFVFAKFRNIFIVLSLMSPAKSLRHLPIAVVRLLLPPSLQG